MKMPIATLLAVNLLMTSVIQNRVWAEPVAGQSQVVVSEPSQHEPPTQVRSVQGHSPQDATGQDFKRLLADIIDSASQPVADQPDAIKQVLATNRWAFTWIAQGHTLSELTGALNLGQSAEGSSSAITNQLNQAFQNSGLNKPYKLLALKSSANLPAAGGVELSRIKVFWNLGSSMIFNFIKNLGRQSMAKSAVVALSRQDDAHLKASLSLVKDEVYRDLSSKINTFLIDFSLGQTEALSSLTKTAAKFPVQNESLNEVAKGLAGYFDTMSLDEKRGLITDFLRLPKGATYKDQMNVLLRYSGPGLLKALQYILRELQLVRLATEGDATELDRVIDVLGSVESNIEEFPKEVAVSLIEKRFGKPISEIFLEFNPSPHPIASGSIGAVYDATLLDGRKVVVKVLRPGIREQLSLEMDRLERLIKLPGAKGFIADFKKLILEEMDFIREALSLKKLGVAYNDAEAGIEVPQAVDGMIFEDVLVVEKFDGVKISKLNMLDETKTLLAQGELLEKLHAKWFDAAVFLSGDYHGDLHPGNILVKYDATLSPPFRIAIIDGGNFGSLTAELRRQLAQVVLAAAKNDPEAMAKTLSQISREPVADLARFESGIRKVFDLNQDIGPRLNKVIGYAIKQGVSLPDYLMSFYRAKSFLEKQIDEVNKRLDGLDPKKDLERFSYSGNYKKIAVKRVAQDLGGQLFGEEAKLVSGGELFSAVKERVVGSDLVKAGKRNCGKAMDGLSRWIKGK